MNIRLENDRLKVTINTLGAEIMSVMDNAGREYMWQGDPDVWKYRAPILFPVCGDLNDSCYTYEGKKYSLRWCCIFAGAAGSWCPVLFHCRCTDYGIPGCRIACDSVYSQKNGSINVRRK